VTGLSLLWQRFRDTQVFLRWHNEALSTVAMCVCNPDRAPVGVAARRDMLRINWKNISVWKNRRSYSQGLNGTTQKHHFPHTANFQQRNRLSEVSQPLT
jgi:hypothetical protein